MPNEKSIKRVTRKSTKVPVKTLLVEVKPLPPVNIAESIKVVLETLEYAKPKEKESVVDVSTGLQF